MNDDRELRRLLDEAVADVEPAYRLDDIRVRTRAPGRRGWYVAGGAVLATAAVVTAFAVLGNPGPDRAGPAAPSSTPSSTPSSASSSTSPDQPKQEDEVTVPVYYVGETPAGPRLYREFHRVPSLDRWNVALRLLQEGPTDPDYTTLWPEGSLGHVSFDGIGADGVFGVDLLDPSLRERPVGMTEEQARLAVQQVVYTLNGIGQDRAPVAFYIDTQGGQVLGVEPNGRFPDDLRALPPNDVLSLVQISDPAEGTVVRGSLVARGRANSFEATVPWQVLDSAGEPVLEGFATASGAYDRLYPWETGPIDVSGLAPGEYTFVATTDDPSGGEGGGPFTDTRTIIVE